MNKKRMAIFASGSGTNAENLIRYFNKPGSPAEISLLLSNNSNAFVLTRAKDNGIATLVFDRKEFYDTLNVLNTLKKCRIDLIVLAGFLWLIPDYLLKAFPGRIINIHPALLPKYGGKGMYGMRVHESVLENKDTYSGITIHVVDEEYDHGDVLDQYQCPVLPGDTPESLAERVHALEYRFYPRVIEKVLKTL